jgi:hypothetical protein
MDGICGLCREEKDLKNSHLLPKALYRVLRSVTRSNPSPLAVAFTSASAWKTDKQVTKYFLCGGCEQLFHKKGEDWTLRHILRARRVFKLLDILEGIEPIETTMVAKVYSIVGVPEIDRSQLTYFAASVFWRGAATDWTISGQPVDPIRLGRQYTNKFQDFLLGRTPFPENCALGVEVCSQRISAAMTFITPAASATNNGYRTYRLVVPGVAFHLSVGQCIPQPIRDSCIATGNRPLVICMDAGQFVANKYVPAIRTARLSEWRKALAR